MVSSYSGPLLEMREVVKRFPGVTALDHVSISLERGEVHALMGENGAGKSTLMKILNGALSPDEGSIVLDGTPVELSSITVAKSLGIALVHQEVLLAPNLDVASNIFLGHEPTASFLPVLDRKRMNVEAKRLLARVGLNVSPTTLVASLTTAQMQMVEICKALKDQARILILDEPTSSLATRETERLLDIIRELRRSSVTVVYISHRIGEVLAIADRITVLRDGHDVGTLNAREADANKIVSMMIGRDLKNWFPKRDSVPGEVVLSVESLRVPGAPCPLSFDATRGEILGFAGLVGSGRTELMEVLAGIRSAESGSIIFENRTMRHTNVRQAIECGICLVPEDRKLQGLILSMSVAENLALPGLRYHSRAYRFQRKWQDKLAHESVKKFRIRSSGISTKVATLSGGTQQKVVLAKWLALKPKLLILDEPTRGIDVGARAEIYEHIVALAESGMTILLVSSDMEEILGLSDRVVVLCERRISGIVARVDADKELIGTLMTGARAA
ncbi:MAG TPA: sugar ABC transporter ATP-binding protein [Terriglobales bacterium]|nr:sugar ABC transporter ATP-binding protein [Terriglobales bacterium]